MRSRKPNGNTTFRSVSRRLIHSSSASWLSKRAIGRSALSMFGSQLWPQALASQSVPSKLGPACAAYCEYCWSRFQWRTWAAPLQVMRGTKGRGFNPARRKGSALDDQSVEAGGKGGFDRRTPRGGG